MHYAIKKSHKDNENEVITPSKSPTLSRPQLPCTMGNKTSTLDSESDFNNSTDDNHMDQGSRNPIRSLLFDTFDSDDTIAWIQDPWIIMKRHIMVNVICLATCMLCWLLSEVKCVGLVRLIFRLKAAATIAYLAIRATRHFLDYRTKQRFFHLFRNFRKFQFLRFGLMGQLTVMESMMRRSMSLLFAAESTFLMLRESLSLLLLYELFLCICLVRIRKPSTKKLLVKVAVIALLLSVMNGCLVIVRVQVSSKTMAFNTFLNVFPVQNGYLFIITVLILYLAIRVLITLRDSSRFREQNGQETTVNVTHVATLVIWLTGVQMVKLALPIANIIHSYQTVKKHFGCDHSQCFDDFASTLSLGEHLSTGNIFALEYGFIAIRAILDRKTKENLE